jgi:hypothetical protein
MSNKIDLNKFTSSLTPGSPDIIPFMIHPYLPPGMIIALCERLPYPKADVDSVFVVRTLQEYADYEWALVQRQYEHGVKEIAPSLRNQGCKHSVNSVNAETRRLSQAPARGRCNDLKRSTPLLKAA